MPVLSVNTSVKMNMWRLMRLPWSYESSCFVVETNLYWNTITSVMPVGNSVESLIIHYISFPTINFPLLSLVFPSSPTCYRMMRRDPRLTPSSTNGTHAVSCKPSRLYKSNIVTIYGRD
jgi:hypothetical protein